MDTRGEKYVQLDLDHFAGHSTGYKQYLVGVQLAKARGLIWCTVAKISEHEVSSRELMEPTHMFQFNKKLVPVMFIYAGRVLGYATAGVGCYKPRYGQGGIQVYGTDSIFEYQRL